MEIKSAAETAWDGWNFLSLAGLYLAWCYSVLVYFAAAEDLRSNHNFMPRLCLFVRLSATAQVV